MGLKACPHCHSAYYEGVAISRPNKKEHPMKQVKLESHKLENLHCVVSVAKQL